jgi:hypothetical protein
MGVEGRMMATSIPITGIHVSDRLLENMMARSSNSG